MGIFGGDFFFFTLEMSVVFFVFFTNTSPFEFVLIPTLIGSTGSRHAK